MFRYAVTDMGNDVEEVLKRNEMTTEDVNWVIPHEANLRIIEAVAKRINLPLEKRSCEHTALRQYKCCYNSFGFVGSRASLEEAATTLSSPLSVQVSFTALLTISGVTTALRLPMHSK